MVKKDELVKRAAAALNGEFTQAEIETVFETLMAEARNALEKGEEVTLLKLGNMRIRQHAETKARDPRTNETVIIPARNVIKYCPPAALKDAVK